MSFAKFLRTHLLQIPLQSASRRLLLHFLPHYHCFFVFLSFFSFFLAAANKGSYFKLRIDWGVSAPIGVVGVLVLVGGRSCVSCAGGVGVCVLGGGWGHSFLSMGLWGPVLGRLGRHGGNII